MKYEVVKLMIIGKASDKKIKKIAAYPRKWNSLVLATTCARVVNSVINYSSDKNNIVNVVVQDDSGQIVFVARTNINGIRGNELGDMRE